MAVRLTNNTVAEEHACLSAHASRRMAASTSSMEKHVIYARQRHVWMNVMYDPGRRSFIVVTYDADVAYALAR